MVQKILRYHGTSKVSNLRDVRGSAQIVKQASLLTVLHHNAREIFTGTHTAEKFKMLTFQKKKHKIFHIFYHFFKFLHCPDDIPMVQTAHPTDVHLWGPVQLLERNPLALVSAAKHGWLKNQLNFNFSRIFFLIFMSNSYRKFPFGFPIFSFKIFESTIFMDLWNIYKQSGVFRSYGFF